VVSSTECFSRSENASSKLSRRSLIENGIMPPRWNAWATLHTVRLDYEKTAKQRNLRLSGPKPIVGEPVRVGMAGFELEGRISRIDGPVLHVKVKATQLKAGPRPRKVKAG
jgi:hypothetical protein